MYVSALAADALVPRPDLSVNDLDRVILDAADLCDSTFMYLTKVPQHVDLIHSRN